MAIKQLSDGGTDGTRLGQNASDLVAFHGATPVAKATCTLSAALTAATTTAANVAAAFAELYAALAAKGIVG
jgi:uncharacterized iron-regulated protein